MFFLNTQNVQNIYKKKGKKNAMSKEMKIVNQKGKIILNNSREERSVYKLATVYK